MRRRQKYSEHRVHVEIYAEAAKSCRLRYQGDGGGGGGEVTFATEDTEKYFDAFYSSMKSVLVHAEYHNVVKLTNKLIYELFRNF